MEIKAQDVKKLRDMTSAGMMDCKKALVEANGDFERAKEIIREKGKLVAEKRADRTTTEGKVIALVDGGKGVVVALGCETDFVSKNADFQSLADAIAKVAIEKFPADAEALMACTLPSGLTVEAAITEQTGKTGEKHSLAAYMTAEAPFVAVYNHVINGKLSALVGFNKEVPAELGKGVAMQVASMKPVSISAEDCPAEVVEQERSVAIEKTKEEQIQKAVDAALKKAGINPAHVDSEDHIESNMSKGWITPEQAAQAREIKVKVAAEKAANLPEQMIQQIANGRVQKFFKENTLEEQEYQMGDGKVSVKDTIKAIDAEAKVTVFKRFSLAD
ncbi:MAG: translation elongation factor Ts [Bacteroidales bacterium]|nr:translation elongation factor Ts [Bacteroidales bacterium]